MLDPLLLLEARDYRSFLKRAFAQIKREKKVFSYQWFAARAGLRSRSFPRDVVHGTKRLTATSTPGFARALGLSGNSRKYFELLVACEEQDVAAGRTPSQLRAALDKLRSRMSLQISRQSLQLPMRPVSSIGFWQDVYACLDVRRGSLARDIATKCGLSDAACEEILGQLLKQGAVRREDETGKYFSITTQLVLNNLDRTAGFRTNYLRNLKLAERAFGEARPQSALFLNSVFSVSERDMPRLKEGLRELLVQFVDQSEVPEGDKLCRLVVGCF